MRRLRLTWDVLVRLEASRAIQSNFEQAKIQTKKNEIQTIWNNVGCVHTIKDDLDNVNGVCSVGQFRRFGKILDN